MFKNSKDDPAIMDLALVCEILSFIKKMSDYELLI